jgi:hypothetical protein
MTQRAAEWRVTLRSEAPVARLLLRRLVGPLTLWDATDSKVNADVPATAGLLDGLIHDGSSSTGTLLSARTLTPLFDLRQ